MSYQLSSEVERLLHEQMLAGGYQSADDLLRDALRALREYSNATHEEDPEVIAGVERGLNDMAGGRYQTLTEFDAAFRKKHGPS